MTKYLCVWSEEVIVMAQKKGINTLDLKGKKASRKEFESYVKAHNPSVIFLNGHGNSVAITGYNNEPIVDGMSALSGAIVYARSCDAGRDLGPVLIGRGTRAFIGYSRKFILGYLPDKIMHPINDPIARLFLEPSNLAVTTMLKGKTAAEAHTRSKEAMYKNFRRMLSSAATYEERFAARWLWSNINGQVLLGDSEARM
ncbi:MAG TPA: hypothetical protein VJK53_04955 [Candidatus Paceibacterota bacterium]